jgi:hypothetical protein
MNFNAVKSDIVGILPKDRKNKSFALVWDLFYYIRLFKYVHVRHFQKIRKRFSHIQAAWKLDHLCKLGYLYSPQQDIYTATDKAVAVLNEISYHKPRIFPPELRGEGSINELNNTEVFIQALKMPCFSTLLYHDFGYIIPDALMMQRHNILPYYKLTFLEIEASKPDWENYLEKKRNNYLRLSQDIAFYNYWASVCPLLDLPKPDIAKLGFSVCIIGNIVKNFGYGFKFTRLLWHERSK